jgi:hypothetical protein
MDEYHNIDVFNVAALAAVFISAEDSYEDGVESLFWMFSIRISTLIPDILA